MTGFDGDHVEGSNDADEANLINARDVARYLKVSIKTIDRLVRAGGLKCVRIGSRGHRRFRLCDVQAVLSVEDHRSQHVGLYEFISDRA